MPKDANKIFFGVVVHDICRRQDVPGVHPHVQLGILRVRKPPLRLVQLHGRDPQVEQHAVGARDSLVGEDGGDLVKHGMHQVHSLPTSGQSLCGDLESLGVSIDADDANGGESIEGQSGVTTQPDRRIDEDGAWLRESRCQQGEDALASNGRVVNEW